MVSIRVFDSDEVGLLEPLVDEFVSSHEGLPFREDYWVTFRDWVQRVSTDSNTTAYIAQDATGIVGFGIGTVEENGPLFFPDKIGYIGLLVVSSRYRRKGIGKKLWEMLRDWFSSRGVKEIQLYTQVDNSVSQNFWRHCGFEAILERRRRAIK